ncbi:hypothetical protein D3C76_1348620 [compost metagenome]
MLRAAVELETEQTDDVDTHADHARGIAGGGIEDEALGPLLGTRLGTRAFDIGIVTTEKVIARLQRSAGARDETWLFGRRLGAQGGGDATTGQASGRGITLWHVTEHESNSWMRATAARRGGPGAILVGLR